MILFTACETEPKQKFTRTETEYKAHGYNLVRICIKIQEQRESHNLPVAENPKIFTKFKKLLVAPAGFWPRGQNLRK